MGRYSSYIAGLNASPQRQAAASWLGPGARLNLVRETDNPHDTNAIRIEHDGKSVGYIPAKHASWCADILDDGRPATAQVTRVTTKGFLWWKRYFVDLVILTGPDAKG